MSKKKPRRLWLQVRVKSAPRPHPTGGRTKPDDVLRELMDSILDGGYELPQGWNVSLYWRNKEDAEWKVGEWTEELYRSAQSSQGFDTAVLSYLEGQLQRIEDRRGRRYDA